MPGTTKGIYVKSNPSCAPGKTAEITDVLCASGCPLISLKDTAHLLWTFGPLDLGSSSS